MREDRERGERCPGCAWMDRLTIGPQVANLPHIEAAAGLCPRGGGERALGRSRLSLIFRAVRCFQGGGQ